jgi:hypothetical protein
MAPHITRYAPRPIALVETLHARGWRLKRYTVRHGDVEFDASRFDPGRDMALAALPWPAETDARWGVGFLIEHQGQTADYVVMCWWDRQNELPVRVFVRDAPEPWRAARGGESMCVWDLQILWAERQAYVATVMQGTLPDRYLAYDTLASIETDGR